jgi:hypothetical protein
VILLLELQLKKGMLSKSLSVAEEDNIPITLLRVIVNTPAGKTIKNPTKHGKSIIKVTELMKKRASLAITMKTIWRHD